MRQPLAAFSRQQTIIRLRSGRLLQLLRRLLPVPSPFTPALIRRADWLIAAGPISEPNYGERRFHHVQWISPSIIY